MNPIKLFLDLEDTVVDNWDDFLFLPSKCEKIKNFIKENNVIDVTIFSFAIDNEKDEAYFIKNHQEDLERILDAKIVDIITVEDMMKVLEFDSLGVSIYAFKIFGKQNVFLNCLYYADDNTVDYVLFDDMVENVTVINHDHNNKIQLINIDSWENSVNKY